MSYDTFLLSNLRSVLQLTELHSTVQSIYSEAVTLHWYQNQSKLLTRLLA